MNRFIAPCGPDLAHHRSRFDPAVRSALGVLDRVAEGAKVPAKAIKLALQVTGDWCPSDMRDFRDKHDLRENARANGFRAVAGGDR